MNTINIGLCCGRNEVTKPLTNEVTSIICIQSVCWEVQLLK